MSGFLDPKERIIDVNLTEEGRKQLSRGKLSIKFCSFSDSTVFYSKLDQFDSGSFTELNTKRLGFEASSRPQDTIIFHMNENGNLNIPTNLKLSGSNDTFKVIDGKLFFISGSSFVTGSQKNLENYSKQILSTSFQNFKDLFLLSSPNFNNENINFKISTNQIEFDITRKSPINVENEIFESNINQAESFFLDKRLSNIPNYKFLPPINKKTNNEEIKPLGIYPNLGKQESLSPIELTKELELLKERGAYKKIEFSNASTSNTIIGQLFEINKNNIAKLDIIDFGIQIYKENNQTVSRHIYFAGKIFLDENGTHTFVNIFTLVFV
jgi:hypothetical protein